MKLRRFAAPVAAAALLPLLGAAAAPVAAQGSDGTNVTVTVNNVRNSDGVVRACITDQARKFHKCEGPNAQRLVIDARSRVTFTFRGVKTGRWAIALLHDENNNDKADSVLGMMPKEGFGFSRDAPVRMGPPSFDNAAFAVGENPVSQSIRMRYIL